MKLSFERRRPGRRGGATRYARLSTKLTRRGKMGANAVFFNARRRGFRTGSYRLTVVATDVAGQRSAPAHARFRVVARSRPRAASSSFAGAITQLSLFARLS